MARSIFFVRHGQTQWNAARRMQGQWNSDLTALGREQAKAHGRLLARFGVQALIASPLGRTRETAAIINAQLKVPLSFDARLKEWDCGDWSGHLFAEVEVQWPTQWAAFEADRFSYRGPNCENYPDMIARTKPLLDACLAHPADVVALVSHGLVGRAMVGTLMGLLPDAMLAIRQGNSTVFRVTQTQARRSVDHFVAEQGPFEGLSVAAPD